MHTPAYESAHISCKHTCPTHARTLAPGEFGQGALQAPSGAEDVMSSRCLLFRLIFLMILTWGGWGYEQVTSTLLCSSYKVGPSGG